MKNVPKSHCFSPQMNNRHPWQLKESKFLEPFLSHQLNSTADLANWAQFWGKWAELALLFSCSKTAPQNFIFFNCPGCEPDFDGDETNTNLILSLKLLNCDFVNFWILNCFLTKLSRTDLHENAFFIHLILVKDIFSNWNENSNIKQALTMVPTT